MPGYRCALDGMTHTFADLKTLMAKASPLKSGDQLAGVGAQSEEERVAARYALAELPLNEFLREPLVSYESDEVTRLIFDSHDPAAFQPVSNLSVGQFRDWLLAYETDASVLAEVAPGLTPEMVAAVSKLMRNQDLILVASKVETAATISDVKPGETLARTVASVS